MGNYGEWWWNYGELWGIMGELWGIMEELWWNYGELWGIMGNHGISFVVLLMVVFLSLYGPLLPQTCSTFILTLLLVCRLLARLMLLLMVHHLQLQML